MAQQKVRADLILRAIAKRHAAAKDLFIAEVKNGPTIYGEHRRMDAIAIKRSWAHPCITGYEVKVSRKDFERDEKWPGYRDMCHRLYFACPADLIQPEELPDDVGLIWYNQEKQTIRTKRAASFRDIEIPGQMLYYLLIARADSDRHPFFSSRREFLEAWVQDKEERRELAYMVSDKMRELVRDVERRESALKRKEHEMREDLDRFVRIKKILEDHGIRAYGWRVESELSEALNRGIPLHVARIVDKLRKDVEELVKAVGGDAH